MSPSILFFPSRRDSGAHRWRWVLLLLAVLGLALTLALLSWTSTPMVQGRKDLPHIGYLTPANCPHDVSLVPTPWKFLAGLQDLGYVEDESVVVDCRVSDGTELRYRDLASELVRRNVDVIFGVSSSAVRGARAVTAKVPIVALDLETDPVASGLAASLARPGGNVTGIFLDLPEMSGKRLEVLKNALPGLSRVAILWDAAMDPAPLRATEQVAPPLGLQLQILSVRGADDFERAFIVAARERAGAVMVIQSPVMDVQRKHIAELALKSRLPTIGRVHVVRRGRRPPELRTERWRPVPAGACVHRQDPQRSPGR